MTESDNFLDSDEGRAAIKEQAEKLANEAIEQRVKEAVSGLQSKNSELLHEVKKLKSLKSQLGDDFDPDEYKTLKEQKLQAEEEAARKAGDWEKLKDSLVQQHSKEVETYKQTLKQQQQSVEKYLIDSQVKSALAEAGANVHLMAGIVKNSIRVVNEDGEFRTVVVDEKGNPRIGSADGSFMTIAQLVKEFSEQDEYAPAFPGTQSSGTGSQGHRVKMNSTKKIAEMTDAEKATLISQIGGQEYDRRRRAKL